MRNKVQKVLLIQPPDPEGMKILRDHAGRFGIVEEKSSVIRYDILPPVFLAYSAALLEENGSEVDIIDSPTLNLKKEKILEKAQEQEPDLIFVNTNAASIISDMEFADWLKSKIKSEIVGITQSFTPEEFLKKSKISIFIRGEIEYTILELCEKYPELEGIEGVFYRKGGKFIYNPDRPFIKDLDKLPIPAYHLLPMDKYSYQMFKGKKFTTVLTSRGCPFGCIYCPYPIGYGNFWRGRSPENVIKELKILTEKYGIKNILFRDQVFNMNPKRVEEICDGIIREGIKLNWRCEGKPELFTEKLLEKMKKAGCVGIHVGIESGDPKVLKSIGKGGFQEKHTEKIKNVFEYARKIGIETVAFFMIGFPGETKESISKTYEWARELRPNRAWFSAVIPYPGTKLHEIVREKGWVLTSDIRDYSGRKTVMKTDHLTKEDIEQAVNKGNYMFSKGRKEFLSTVFSWRGIKSAILNPQKAFNFTFGKFFNRNSKSQKGD